MGISRLGIFGFAATLCLTNCAHAGDDATLPAASALHASANANFVVLHSFTGARSDGASPAGSLAILQGSVVGTTTHGGAADVGTVYRVTPGGEESVIHSFGKGDDGRDPEGGVTLARGSLFGTTFRGGSHGAGTLFSIGTNASSYAVIHDFGGASDGSFPAAPPIAVQGSIYGTTTLGGACAEGTVFRVDGSGEERVVHSFGCGAADGRMPRAFLIAVGELLYGTTAFGGARGGGAVFTIDRHSNERVLHSFRGSDGFLPSAGLIYAGGAFYGTTQLGGAHGFGTVFVLNASGRLRVLHSFGIGSDGQYPVGELTYAGGSLFGVTSAGGTNGAGTVYGLRTDGTDETVLHNFSLFVKSEPAWPLGALAFANGTLYGTTHAGGTDGLGTLFAIDADLPR